MAEDDNPHYQYGKVKGDMVNSNNQSGGVTAHTINYHNTPSSKKEPFYKKFWFWVGCVATVLTILGYFGFQPNRLTNRRIMLKVLL